MSRVFKLSALALVVIAGLSFVAGNANAQVYYLYPGAPVVSEDSTAAGALFGFGDGLDLRLLGYLRFNVNEKSDLGFEILIDRSFDSGRFGLGADYKYAIVPKETQMPFDLSLNGGFGFQTGGDRTNIDVPVGAIISRPIELENGKEVVPYGGLYILYRHLSYDIPAVLGGGTDSDSDLDLELRGGASLQVIKQGRLFGTVHIGNDFAVFFGFDANM